MKIRDLLFLLIPLTLCGSASSAVFYDVDTPNGILHVEGRGYPPVQSESMGQARLMAKRAAVLDAYRNVLGLIGGKREYGWEEEELAVTYGYIRGAKVIHEVLLSDGGVLVTVAYPLSDEEMNRLRRKESLKGSADRRRASSASDSVTLSGPLVVDLETWIERIKDARKRSADSNARVLAAPKKTIHQLEGVHPVTFEQWISIVTNMRER